MIDEDLVGKNLSELELIARQLGIRVAWYPTRNELAREITEAREKQ